MKHPRDILLGAQGAAGVLPVCDHYCGVEALMVKSLQLQAELMQEFGACVLDVTLDCEDGAPVGGELDHANMVAELALSAQGATNFIAKGLHRRIGVRLHAIDHPAFASDVDCVLGQAAHALSYVMIPKVESVEDVKLVVAALASLGEVAHALPIHVLIESPAAVHRAFEIAAHPRVQSLSFGLMDFVSSHAGAIPASAMRVHGAQGVGLDQFHHPLVVRAKLEMASACHAYGKVPSHCVVTEFRDPHAVLQAAQRASQALGYTRMWSIHPDQIRPILQAFSPSLASVEEAAHIIGQAQHAEWGPVAVDGVLHDRASYRFYWQTLERAHATGVVLPLSVRRYFHARYPELEKGPQ